MSVNTPTSSNQILVDGPDAKPSTAPLNGQELAGWLTSYATKWESFRDRGYAKRWAEYWRMWRGMWAEDDRNRASERSRLIAPALAQAIEMTVAEIEEGLLSKEVWFDTPDNLADEDKKDAAAARDLLIEDFDKAGIKDSIAESVLVGALFGTGLIKLNVEVIPDENPVRNPETKKLEAVGEERVLVTAEALRPDEVIPDPSGRTVAEMQGIFHKIVKSQHYVLEKIEAGVYNKSALPFVTGVAATVTGSNYKVDYSTDVQAELNGHESDNVEILEYHGKVPLHMLNDATADTTAVDSILAEMEAREDAGPISKDTTMVEAIVTIANGSTILRAIANPFVMKDRSIIAFQFEKVPGRFWGRGVAEKGYNPQKALDAELRSRGDALGFISSPMMGVDAGRIPRGFKMEVRPGKVWLTQGPPNEVIRPVEIGNLQQATFGQADAMERMVQMGTGAFDTASSLQGGSGQSQSGSQTSLMMGAFVKRSKRAIRMVNDNLIAPFIKKAMWRYMQFAPNRYPTDFNFSVKPTLGIVAREVEAMQLTQLMGMLPDEYPQVNLTVAQGIIELSSVHNKAQVMASFEQALQPPSEEEQARQKELSDLEFEATKAQAEAALLANQKTLAEIREILSRATIADRKADTEDVKLEQETARIQMQGEDLINAQTQNDIAYKRLELQEKQVAANIANLHKNNQQ